MVLIGSSLMVSHKTSIVSNIVSIFDVQVLSPKSRTVQGHLRFNVVVPIDSPGMVSYLTSIDPIMVSVTVLEIFDITAIFQRNNGD